MSPRMPRLPVFPAVAVALAGWAAAAEAPSAPAARLEQVSVRGPGGLRTLAGEVLVAAGLCEALTRSVVAEALAATPSPWGEAAALVISPPQLLLR